ncbi:MAG TPA: DUF1549 and DUF1553 domain-containing protein, partial [Humisphaera sp.]|nr:DUF1549 and DUF1553 domain-containing protein [Humisphaera sp.]
MQPLVRPAVPAADPANNDAVNPVDAFIRGKLHDAGLSPSTEADRRTLIRRLTFDLHGLPPSPQEIDAFVKDADPHAYEHLVDRLLASPRYGERMARRWLDVVHYGESDGFGMDRPRMNAWPYRDYLIRSFNEDKPYARLVQEQIAADAMFPDKPAVIPALGFLSAGPFNQSALSEQTNGTLCWKLALNLDRDDMVSNVATSFLSVTLHCARCHNHKFDPITQGDYYRMQSNFAGLMRGDRDYDDDINTTRQRKRWMAVRQQIQTGAALAALASADRDELLGVKDAVAKSLVASETKWQTLAVSATADSGRTTSTALPDGSIRFAGGSPDHDTYVLAAKSPLESTAALRLEVLTDDALPHHGPGREANGAFRLTEFRVIAAASSSPEKITAVKIRAAFADFNESGFEVSRTIDNLSKTAWGIHPREGQSHEAVFIFDKPVAHKGGALFTVRLEQLDGKTALIGRLRLSACASEPEAAEVVSPDLVAMLKAPKEKRPSDAERKISEGLAGAMVERKLAEIPPPHKVFAVADDLPPLKSYRLPKDALAIHVLQRGDVTKPTGDVVRPGALDAVGELPAAFKLSDPNDEKSRRTALAQWITDPNNPLTWRSMANRIWLWQFDRGIVETANDFGKMGSPPSHPQLLDWLACELRDDGGSIKKLTRLIVTSKTYRQSSPQNDVAAKVDGDNKLLWRMNRHRLDAEQLRDSLLAVSGKLDATMGGPSAIQFIGDFTTNPNVAPRVSYDNYNPDDPASLRRGVYRFLLRNVSDPLLEAFDAPNCSLATPKRDVTVTPLQTLSLFNNKFVLRQCEHLADRLTHESSDPADQIDEAYVLLYGRPPTSDELSLVGDYAKKHGLPETCRVLVNANKAACS